MNSTLLNNIDKVLNLFSIDFSRPQIEHLKSHAFGLIKSGHGTLTSIKRELNVQRNISSMSRFLSTPFLDKKLEKNRLKAISKQVSKSKKNFIIGDDSLLAKTGKHMEGADWFFDHCLKKFIFGYNVVNTCVVPDGVYLPATFELYKKHGETKIKSFQRQIQTLLDNGIKGTVLFDAWYFSKDFVNFLKGKSLFWITRAKKNRKIIFNGKEIPLKKLKFSEKKKIVVKIKGSRYECFSRIVEMKNVGKVKIVICKNEKGKKAFLCTNNLKLSTRKILKDYSVRWSIETGYRDEKQCLGLDSFQCRKIWSVTNAIALSLTAHLAITLSQAKGFIDSIKTIGETCEQIATNILERVCRFIHYRAKKGYSLTKTMEKIQHTNLLKINLKNAKL